jgi:biotin carboxyl carrier protein
MTAIKDINNEPARSEGPIPELRVLHIGGEAYCTRLTKKYKNKPKWEKPNKKCVLSFIPGTVCRIFVKPGDVVDAGSQLLILEAMKMQNIIFSPIAGKITSVGVREGEKIGKGVLMVEFE